MLQHAHLAFRSDISLGAAHFFGIFWTDFLSHLSKTKKKKKQKNIHTHSCSTITNISTPTSFHFLSGIETTGGLLSIFWKSSWEESWDRAGTFRQH